MQRSNAPNIAPPNSWIRPLSSQAPLKIAIAGLGTVGAGVLKMLAANQALIEKINTLPRDRLAEVEDFVDFIRQRDQDRALVRAAGAASTPTFAAVWDQPEDDAYDAL